MAPRPRKVIEDGLRTGDIFGNAPGTKKVNTKEIGAAITAALRELRISPSISR